MISNLCVLAYNTLVSILYPPTSQGGTAASIISFILPGLFLMDKREDTNTSTPIISYFLVIGGTLVGVLSTWITLYGLFSTTKDAPSNTPCDL